MINIPPTIHIFDSGFRGKCPKEAAEQATFFNRIRREYPNTYGRIATHIENEGKRNNRQIQRAKSQGLVKGASDIMIPGSPSFVCELKRKDRTKSKITQDQIGYLEACAAMGAFACLAFGCDEAWRGFQQLQINTQNLTPRSM